MSLRNEETQSTLLEESEASAWEGFRAYKSGDMGRALVKARTALRINPYDMLAIIVMSLLDPTYKKEELYESPAHIAAFAETTRSPNKQDQYAVSANIISGLSDRLGLNELCLADIGIGTGAFELALAKRMGDRGIRVAALDPKKKMLDISRDTLRFAGMHYEAMQCDAQTMPEEVIASIRGRIDVALGMHSLHHGTIEEKRRMLQNIRSIDPKYLVINDGNTDHESDLPAMSDELAINVRRIFSTILENQCKWADEHCPGRPEMKAALRKFNFDEARAILTREYSDVRDYHTTAARWKILLEQEGFAIVNPKNIPDLGKGAAGPIEITDDAVFIRITQGIRLYFAMIAQPVK